VSDPALQIKWLDQAAMSVQHSDLPQKAKISRTSIFGSGEELCDSAGFQARSRFHVSKLFVHKIFHNE